MSRNENAVSPIDERTSWSADRQGRPVLALTVTVPGDSSTYQLAISEPKLDNAIHGLTRFAIFDLVGRTEASVTLRSQGHGSQGYPFAVQVDPIVRSNVVATVAVTAA